MPHAIMVLHDAGRQPNQFLPVDAIVRKRIGLRDSKRFQRFITEI
jgi:hypothetical protein